MLTDSNKLSKPLKRSVQAMAKRSKIPQKQSQRSFSRHAKVHPKNTPPIVMRGGIRF